MRYGNKVRINLPEFKDEIYIVKVIENGIARIEGVGTVAVQYLEFIEPINQ